MNEGNKAIVRRYFTEVLRDGKYDSVKEIFSPPFTFHCPSLTKLIRGMPEGIYHFVATMRKPFPDLYVSIENKIAKDRQVVVVRKITGTYQHLFRNVPPAGKQMTITRTSLGQRNAKADHYPFAL